MKCSNFDKCDLPKEDGCLARGCFQLKEVQVEKLFCFALVQESPDVIQRVTTRYLDYKEREEEVLEQIKGSFPTGDKSCTLRFG